MQSQEVAENEDQAQ